MTFVANKTELAEFLLKLGEVKGDLERRQVVRNGYLLHGEVIIGLGSFTVQVCKIRGRNRQ
jgi:hypothetical protein